MKRKDVGIQCELLVPPEPLPFPPHPPSQPEHKEHKELKGGSWGPWTAAWLAPDKPSGSEAASSSDRAFVVDSVMPEPEPKAVDKKSKVSQGLVRKPLGETAKQ
eukprot:3371339-Alexandrium_andersonii.AAC.1